MDTDLKEVFTQILASEEEFIGIYERLLKEMKTPEAIKIVSRILNDEKLHAKNAREILEILDN